MILIFAYSDVPRKQIVNIADSLGGSIVGEIPEIYQYQIQVGAVDKESLEFYCKKVMRFKEVKYAIIDRVYSMEKEDIALPNDIEILTELLSLGELVDSDANKVTNVFSTLF